MSPGDIVHLMGKIKVRASFGSITYGPRPKAKKDSVVARVLVLPPMLVGAELAAWLKHRASEVQP